MMKRLLIGITVLTGFCCSALGAVKIAKPNQSTGVSDIGLKATWDGTFPTTADSLYYYQSFAEQDWQNRFYLDGSAKSDTKELVVGTSYVSDNPNTAYKDTPMKITLDLLGGAKYTVFGSIYLNNQYGSSFSTLRVRGEGTALAATGITAVQGSAKLQIEDGASVTVEALSVGMSQTTTVTNEIVVSGATLNVTNAANFGQYYQGWNPNSVRKVRIEDGSTVHVHQLLSLYDTDMTIGNAAVTFDYVHSDHDTTGELTLNRGATLTITGGSVTGGHWSVGMSRGGVASGEALPPLNPAKLRITGGHHVSRFLELGINDHMTGILEVDGEDAVLEFGANFYGRYGYGAGCTGLVTLARGTMALLPNTAQTLRLATGSGSYGELNVKGGLFDYLQDCTSGIWMDNGGNSKITVSGGELRSYLIRILPSAGYRADVVQSGGLINLTDYAYAQSAGSHIVLTGGEFHAPRIAAIASLSDVTFHSDGGAIVVNGTTSSGECGSKAWFENFTSVTFGAKGLSFDTEGYDSKMKNAFANASGEKGLFVKKGNGSLTASGSYAVAQTRVEKGTLVSAATSFATALWVEPDSTFSLAGDGTTATLSSLAVTNGTIRLDPTDVITVTGSVTLENPSVELSSLPAKGTPCNLLVVTGELDDETAAAWRHAISLNIVDGQHVSFTYSYDAGSGKTTMTATLKDNTPLTDKTTWIGSGAWETVGNWSAGVPTATKIADFSGTPTSREVTVGSGAEAGAFSFSGGHYKVQGGDVTMDGEKGQVRIDAAAASTNVITTAIRTWTPILSSGDGSVALNGTITGGGIEKSGKGHLALGAANAFTQPIVQCGGVLESAAVGALTTIKDVRHMLGAMKFTVKDTVSVPFRQAPAASTDLTTINNTADVTFTDWRPEAGRVLKRGAGTMTVKFREDAAPVFYTGGAASANWYILPEDGTMPYNFDATTHVTNYYPNLAGLTVVEGNLVLTSDTPEQTVKLNNVRAFVGINSKNGTTDARMTVRDIDMTFVGDTLLELGQQSYRGCSSTQPTFELVNSTTYFNNICVGDWCYGMDSHPTVILNNSWLSGGSQVKLSQANGWGNSKTDAERAYVYWRAKDSKVSSGVNCYGFSWFGGLKLDFDHSTMSRKDGACDTFGGMGQYSYGYMNFTNDSTFAISNVTALGLTHDCRFRFAGSTWKVNNNLSLSSANVTPQYFIVESYAEGLNIDVPVDKTFTFQDVTLTGDGGLTVTGGGTVKFGNGMYRATGLLLAESGTVDLSGAGTVEGATIGAGAGVIKGGSFHNATIVLDEQGGAVPNFESCAFTGTTRVSIGGELVKEVGVPVANYTGSFSGIGTFEFDHSQSTMRGSNFRTEDGKIVFDLISKRGIAIVFW